MVPNCPLSTNRVLLETREAFRSILRRTDEQMSSQVALQITKDQESVMAGAVGNQSRRRSTAGKARSPVAVSTDATSTAKLRSEKLHEAVIRQSLSELDRRSRNLEIGESVLRSSRVMRSPNFTLTTNADLQRMAELYDHHFFGGHCLALARQHGMKFRWSKRMTSTGGKTVRTMHSDPRTNQVRTKYEIVLSATLLFQTFSDLKRPIRVTGLLCTNRLQAMQRILEHELIHLAEMLVWNDSCCAAPRFQKIAGRLFGHTEHKHDLITQQERAASKFNIRVGTRVRFSHDGRKYVGTVNRITRRATVLVQDSQGQLYDDGGRYKKYYVPISHLRPAS